ASDEPASTELAEDDPADPPPPSFTRPDRIRGIYLNAWLSGSTARTETLIEMARRTEINTFVIDVKDDTGYLSYRTGVELAGEIGADQELRILDIGRLLRRLEEEGIYPIARIVLFKDHLLAQQRPDMAIQDSAGGVWVDGRGDVWVNPYDERVWAYHAEIAREAVELGFPEIQWDYVRFPDRPQSELERAVFPGRGERTRSQAIRDFLVWSGEELHDLDVPLSADVFGMATSARSDVGIGQLWEDFIDVVDAALPMIYPSHYWEGSFGIQEPNAHPYEVVGAALRHAVRRNAEVENPGRIIPWLQDFTLGSPRYEGPEVRAQILATYDAGIEEWILWNSAGRYTEAAFEPVGGWGDSGEPWIRFDGEIVPADSRLAVPAASDEAEAGADAGQPRARDAG
ncbi:MAG: putative glycoside hydrolase, partial [Gemmatimonadota bacterium]